VKLDYDLIEKNFNILEAPTKLDPKQCTIIDIYLHARFKKRRKQRQVIKLLQHRQFMEHYIVPVDFTLFENTAESYDRVEKFLRHREIIEFDECKKGKGASALHNDWACIRMHLDAYKIPHGKGTIWDYLPPKRPKKTRIHRIPFPNQLHEMLHLKYHKDNAVDAMIKTMLICNYFIGWRFPSEMFEAKVSDINFEREEILVHSQKYDWAERYVDISEIAHRRNIKNLYNWVNLWRPRLIRDDDLVSDYLFFKPDGTPFKDTENLRIWFEHHVKKIAIQVFPEYFNYGSRYWNGVARLIRSKIMTGHFDIYEVCAEMGHSSIKVTEGYVNHAKYFHKKEPYDWFKRVLKFHKMKEENTLKSLKPKKQGVAI